jgi:hypothetical protein
MSHAIGRDSLLFIFIFRHFFLATKKSLSLESQPTDGRQACFANDERAIFTMPLITDAKKKKKKNVKQFPGPPRHSCVCSNVGTHLR